MTDLSTTYLGLNLRNPIIAGSSTLTGKVDKIKALENSGAGAVVLKSIFEEEITLEYEKIIEEEAPNRYKDDYLDYLDYRIKQENLSNYVKLITDAKKSVKIPVIASINCNTVYEWSYFAKSLQEAGADAIELNLFIMPSDIHKSSAENETLYLKIIDSVRSKVTIPVAVKISFYFSALAGMVKTLSESGIQGIVMFNRFFSPDINIHKLEVTGSHVFSSPSEIAMPLRWTAIMANRVNCDLCASTGIHEGEDVIKLILAGSSAVQCVSTLYKNGAGKITQMLAVLETWMNENKYQKIDDFRGKMSQSAMLNAAIYDRIQFMRYFSDWEHSIQTE